MARQWIFRTPQSYVVALATLALLIGTYRYQAKAADPNPYVELYNLRVSQSEANLKRKQAVVTLTTARLNRGRILMPQQAMSQEEYDTIVSENEVAKADVELATQKIDEAKAYLKIIQGLTDRGVAIPLCTYEME